MTKFIFDLTGTAHYLRRITRFSGIQRTVVMLIEKASNQIGVENVHLGLYDKSLRSYRTFPLSALAPGELTDAELLRARLGYGPPNSGLHPALRKYYNKPRKLWFHRSKLRLAAFIGYERPFARRNTTREEWRKFHTRKIVKVQALPFVSVDSIAGPGDHFVLLDATFAVPKAAKSFCAIRAMGLKTCTMVYDLVPIVIPGVVVGLGPVAFYDSLLETESYTDRYLTDSDSARRDLKKFLVAHDIERPIHVVSLAQAPLPLKNEVSEGPMTAKVSKNTYPKLLEAIGIDDRIRALTNYPYVLCAGTLEARKNNWRLAMVWDRLRHVKGLQLPKLVFAGRSGWLNDDFRRLMQSTGHLGGWIEIVEGPSDRELEYLYKNCEFIAMPSLYEGWGLPVGEALSYGKTGVVSNVASLPEVGLDLVEYCDPKSIDSIAEACMRLIKDPARRIELEKRIRETSLRTWDDVARDLVLAITEAP
jgi:glycosyltransferase involved in cell wall biosynthesis